MKWMSGTTIFMVTLLVIEVHTDWLITDVENVTELRTLPSGVLRLTNGLIHRDFILTPDFTTVDIFSYEKNSSLLRAISPEAVIGVDGLLYNVGGVKTSIPRSYLDRAALAKDMTADIDAFHYAVHKTMTPKAKFPYKIKRGAPKDIVWPPRGLRLDVSFKAPFTAPLYHQQITVTVHYEMYDGIPLMAKWLSIEAPSNIADMVYVSVPAVEYLAINQQWADEGIGNNVEESQAVGLAGDTPSQGWFFVETDQSHGAQVIWDTDPSQSLMPGSFEPIVNCTYQMQPMVPISKGFESFRIHELIIGFSDSERMALSKHRMMRLLAPQTQENPIFFHLTNSSSQTMRQVIDQMAEVGFEMMIYSFGSGIDMESENETYIAQVASDVAYARSKGIEVGAYDLIALTRKVKPEWMAIGGSGACFASGWYDKLLKQLLMFFKKTGMTMIETDGPYGGYTCNSSEHSHHTGYEDSVYWQQKLQGQFYSILQENSIYTNQPDRYFYQGGSKTGEMS